MKVSIFGIGYVGAVTAGCLCKNGHRVTCVDINEDKVEGINAGRSPLFEPGLDDLLKSAVDQQLLSATTDCQTAVDATDVSIICVGTPSLESGRLNLKYARTVFQQISQAVESKGKNHILIIRSTMLPGSVRDLSKIAKDLIASGQLTICFCPEFLREGSAISDFHAPALAVYGSLDEKRNETVEALLPGSELMPLEASELVKYACNYWHAVKVAFGNEIGRLSKHLSVDGQAVMKMFCRDTVLNISPNYMRPGTPFGGSCLPKDVSALNAFARQEGIPLPMLESILNTNQAHLDHLIKVISRENVRRVLIVGLSFKKGTDDLRGSPMVAVAETLLGKGYEVEIYDTNIDVSRLTGSNEAEQLRRLPHLASRLIPDFSDAVSRNELIVFAQDLVESEELASVLSQDKIVVDINGISKLKNIPCKYQGLCWD